MNKVAKQNIIELCKKIERFMDYKTCPGPVEFYADDAVAMARSIRRRVSPMRNKSKRMLVSA